MSSWIGAPFVWLRALIVLATVVEFASFLRVRRWNWWLTLLVSTTLLQQLLVSAVLAMARVDGSPLNGLVLSLSSLASASAVFAAAAMTAHRVWSERASSGQALAGLRGMVAGGALVLFWRALSLAAEASGRLSSGLS